MAKGKKNLQFLALGVQFKNTVSLILHGVEKK